MATHDSDGNDPPPLPASPTPKNWAWRVMRAIVAGIFPSLLRWRHTIIGSDNVPDDGPAVITWNHHSYTDFLMLALAVYDECDRVVRILGKSEIWDNPVLAWIANQASAVPVYRDRRGGGGALSAAIEALGNGDLVVVAPERTISQSFELLPFAPGAAIMATKAGVPVVPSVGWGSHRFSTKDHSFNRDHAIGLPVTTRFGPPLHPREGESVDEFNRRLHDATEQLLHEVQRDYPDRPDGPDDAWWLPARLGGAAPPHDEVLARHDSRMQGRRVRDQDGDGSDAAGVDDRPRDADAGATGGESDER